MAFRRPRKIVHDLSANVIEEMRLRALRDDCDKIMLDGGKFEKLIVKAYQIRVGDQSRSEPDTRTVTATSNMQSAYPIIVFDDGNIQPYDKNEDVCVFRPTASENVKPPISAVRIDSIKVNDIVYHEDEPDVPMRVYGKSYPPNGLIHLMCTPLDVQKHGYGPIHIYGPDGKLVRKRKV